MVSFAKPTVDPRADFTRRHTLGHHLAQCLTIRDGVDPGTAVAAGLHVATMPDLWQAVAAGRSIIVFAPSGYFTRLLTRDDAENERRNIMAMLPGDAPEDSVKAVDVAPMVAALTLPAERN